MLDLAPVAENPRAIVGGNKPPLDADTLADMFAAEVADLEMIADRANSLPKKVASDETLIRFGDVAKDAAKLSKKLDSLRSAEKEPHLTAGRTIDAFFKAHTERLEKIATVIGDRATEYQREKVAAARRAAEEAARKAREAEDAARQKAQEAADAQRHSAVARHEDRAEDHAERARQAEAIAAESAATLTRVRSTSGTVATTATSWAVEIDPPNLDLEALRPYFARDVLQKAANAWLRMSAKGASEAPTLRGARVFRDERARFR